MLGERAATRWPIKGGLTALGQTLHSLPFQNVFHLHIGLVIASHHTIAFAHLYTDMHHPIPANLMRPPAPEHFKTGQNTEGLQILGRRIPLQARSLSLLETGGLTAAGDLGVFGGQRVGPSFNALSSYPLPPLPHASLKS